MIIIIPYVEYLLVHELGHIRICYFMHLNDGHTDCVCE